MSADGRSVAAPWRPAAGLTRPAAAPALVSEGGSSTDEQTSAHLNVSAPFPHEGASRQRSPDNKASAKLRQAGGLWPRPLLH